MDIKKLGGLPAHPLLVHIPIVLIPLVAVGAVLAAASPRFRAPFRIPLVLLALAAFVGTWLAKGSGESLEESVRRSALVHDHTELGDKMLLYAGAFLVVIVLFATVDWWRSRVPAGGPGAMAARGPLESVALFRVLQVAVIVASLVTVGFLYRVGHSGARAVWKNDSQLVRPLGGDGD